MLPFLRFIGIFVIKRLSKTTLGWSCSDSKDQSTAWRARCNQWCNIAGKKACRCTGLICLMNYSVPLWVRRRHLKFHVLC